jgi:hypothetical protein
LKHAKTFYQATLGSRLFDIFKPSVYGAALLAMNYPFLFGHAFLDRVRRALTKGYLIPPPRLVGKLRAGP